MAKKDTSTTDNFNAFMALFDPANVSKAFDPQVMMEQFGVNPANMDPQDTIKKARDHFDAMAKANEAAAKSYRDLLEKQMQIFHDVTSEAAVQAKAGPPQDVPAAYQQAVKRALEIMTELSDSARDANNQAYDAVKEQVEETIRNLKK